MLDALIFSTGKLETEVKVNTINLQEELCLNLSPNTLMQLKIEPYLTQKEKFPKTDRHILAQL